MLQIYSHRFINLLVKPDPTSYHSRAGWSYLKLHFLAAFADENQRNETFLKKPDATSSIVPYTAPETHDSENPRINLPEIKQRRRKRQDGNVSLRNVSIKQLSWFKLINPFKWIEFAVGILLQTLSAAFYFCCLAIRNLPLLLIVPTITCVKENSGKYTLNKRLTVLNGFFAVIFGALHFIFYLAMDFLMLALNSVLSPWNSLIKPLFNFFRKSGDYTSLFMILASVAISALLISSVVFTFTGIPQIVMVFSPLLTPIINLITPTLMFLSGHLGILLTELICGIAIPLVVLPLAQRIFDKDTYYNLGIHYMNAYGFVKDFLFLVFPNHQHEPRNPVGRKVAAPERETDGNSDRILLNATHAESKTLAHTDDDDWGTDKSFVRVLCSTHVLAKPTDLGAINQPKPS